MLPTAKSALRVGANQKRTFLSAARPLQKAGTWMPGKLGSATDLVHACVEPDEKTGAILTPLYQSTTFVQSSVEEYLAKGYSYSRTNNPTVKVLEDKVSLGARGVLCF